MKKSAILMVVIAIQLLASCKNGTLKITNANDLINEFKENQVSALAKYKGQTVEFVGTFNNISGSNTDGTYPLIMIDSSLKINSQVRIFSSINKEYLIKNQILPYLSEKYFYNETNKAIYTDESMKELAKSALTNSDQTTDNNMGDMYDMLVRVDESIKVAMNCKNYPVDTNAYLTTREIKIDKDGNGFFYPMDTEINVSYKSLASIVNDIKANKIHKCDTSAETVIDKITLKGKIKDISFTKTNGGDDVMVIEIDNPEIVSKERVLDLNKLPALNFTGAQNALQEKIKSMKNLNSNWKYYKVNDQSGADLTQVVDGQYKVTRKVLPTEKFEIISQDESSVQVKFENGSVGHIEKSKVIKFE